MSIQQKMIEAAKSCKYASSRNYKNFSFYDIGYGHKEDGFINNKTITFEDHVSDLYLTGNELFYYPTLAKKIREIKDYPTIKRSYSVDTEISGMAFIEYFYKRTLETFNNFQAEVLTTSCATNNLIYLHGAERHTPIINQIESELVNSHYTRKKLVINNVLWCLDVNDGINLRGVDYINLFDLLNIPYSYRIPTVEDAVLGTPFVALRLRKTWSHKGRVVWYNLDTCKPVSKSNIKKWKG